MVTQRLAGAFVWGSDVLIIAEGGNSPMLVLSKELHPSVMRGSPKMQKLHLPLGGGDQL